MAIHRTIARAAGALALAVPLLAGAPTIAADGPYVVRGNQHIIIGITLDEAAVRAALPEGLEPAEGVTGGLNFYKSDGGEGVAAYQRTYVWVDVANFDSRTGAKGRYILWAADSTHRDKLAKGGYDVVVGDTALAEDGNTVSATTTIDGGEVMKVAVELTDAGCGPGMGTIDYPSQPAGGTDFVMTQYTFAGQLCGAKPVSVDISAPADHPLNRFKPASVVWAAVARELSFSASPLLPIKLGSTE